MSSSSIADSEIRAAYAELFSGMYPDAYCNLATSVLLIYEAILTVEQEVACFWTNKCSGVSLLFFLNRYIALGLNAVNLVSFAPFSLHKSCDELQKVWFLLQLLQLASCAAFAVIRACAVSKSMVFGTLVLALYLPLLGAHVVPYVYGASGTILPPFGCVNADRIPQDVAVKHGAVVIIGRTPVIVADVLLIYTTWRRLGSRDALRELGHSRRPSLPSILLRDGTIHFVVLFTLNVLHLVFSLLSEVVVNQSGWSYLTTFTNPLTTILVSRFLLQLHETSQTTLRVDPDDPLYLSMNLYDDTPSFIRSMGSAILPNPPNDDDHSGSHLDSCSDEK